jgi:hypothetical protein
MFTISLNIDPDKLKELAEKPKKAAKRAKAKKGSRTQPAAKAK